MKKTNNLIYKNFIKSLRSLKLIKYYFLFSLILFFFITFVGLILPIFFEEEILKLIQELISQTENLNLLELIRFIIVNNIQSSFFGIILGIFLAVFPVLIIIINAYVLGFVMSKAVELDGILVTFRLLPHGIFEIPAVLISVSLGIMIGINLMKNCIKYYNKNISYTKLLMLIFLSILPLFSLILLYPSIAKTEDSGLLSLFIFLGFISFMIFLIYTSLTLSKKELRKSFFNDLLFSSRIFILVVIPLLVIAGIIEGVLIFLMG